jgi:hypothetical protein
MDDVDDYGREGASTRDVNLVRAYGHGRDDFVSVLGERRPEYYLVALFTGNDIDVHARELSRLVSRPDRLEVRRHDFSSRYLDDVCATIKEELMARQASAAAGERIFISFANSGHVVGVWLHANQEEYAADLIDRFGSAVDVRIGTRSATAPSTRTASQGASSTTRPRPLPDGVTARVEDDLIVVSGRFLETTLHVANHTERTFVLDTNGGLTASVVDPATLETVGGAQGFQTMALHPFVLAPRATARVPLLIGTASSSSALGLLVPAGAWAIVVHVTLRDEGRFVTSPIPLTILPRDQEGPR